MVGAGDTVLNTPDFPDFPKRPWAVGDFVLDPLLPDFPPDFPKVFVDGESEIVGPPEGDLERDGDSDIEGLPEGYLVQPH